MISPNEVAYAIYGAWRLAKFDPQGIDFFDNTVEAFWRSFWAAAIVVPMFAVIVVLRLTEIETVTGPLNIFMIETISYITGWFAFPFAMFYVAQLIDRDEHYLRFIVAHNWAGLLQMTLLFVMTIIAHSGAFGPGVGLALGLAATSAILIYQWYIVRVGLDVSGPGAAGIVFLDLIISIVLNAVTSRMI